MKADGIQLEAGSSIERIVLDTSRRHVVLPEVVVNGSIIELSEQDGDNAPGNYIGVAGVWEPMGSKQTEVYDMATTAIGRPDAADIVFNMTLPTRITIPANFVGSRARANTPPAGNVSFAVQRVDAANVVSALGTVNFSVGNRIGVFSQTGSGNMLMAVGDTLQIVAPEAQDADLADIGIVITAAIAK